ncbi:MAG: hypothetical protein HYY54_08330 [candidate division NC10 bacterium]|nr:hypothetical protein [candidate division NC10 bacterium]
MGGWCCRRSGREAWLAAAAVMLFAFLAAPRARAQPASMAEAVEQAIAAGVPAGPVRDLAGRWEGRGLPTRAGVAVLAAVTQSAREGLPSLSLLQKATEGLSKGAPPERIAEVVERRARALREAQRVLQAGMPDLAGGREARERALEAVADALFQGAPGATLQRIVERAAAGRGAEGARWIEAAADSLVSLMSSGLPAGQASDLVILRLREAPSPEAVRQLAAEALALRRTGLSPGQAAARLRRDLEGIDPRPGLPRPPVSPVPTPIPPIRLPTR